MNTLAQGSAAFIIYCFVFLEKMPVLECFMPDSVVNKRGERDYLNTFSWQLCDKE